MPPSYQKIALRKDEGEYLGDTVRPSIQKTVFVGDPDVIRRYSDIQDILWLTYDDLVPTTKHDRLTTVFFCLSGTINNKNISKIQRVVKSRKVHNKGMGHDIGMYIITTSNSVSLPSPKLPVITTTDNGMLDQVRATHQTWISSLYKMTITASVGTVDSFNLTICAQLDQPDTISFNKLCAYLREILTDHVATFRHELCQRYRIPNVQLLDCTTKAGTLYTATVECTPNDSTMLNKLKMDCVEQLPQLIQNELKKTAPRFDRSVSVRVSMERFSQVSRDCGTRGKLQCDGAMPVSESYKLASDGAFLSKEAGKKTVIRPELMAQLLNRIKDARHARSEFLQWLQQHKADLRAARTEAGYNALHLVVDEQRADLISCFVYCNLWSEFSHDRIKSGAKSDKCEGFTPRRLAESLISKDSGMDVLNEYDKWGKVQRTMSDLSRLVLTGDTDLVKEVLKTNNNPLSGIRGYSPLLLACAAGYTKIMELFLNHKADHRVITPYKETCLHLVCQFGHSDLLPLLLKTDIDRHAKDSLGLTALDHIAISGHLQMFQTWTNTDGQVSSCFLPLAAKNQHHNLVKLALESGLCSVDDVDECGKSAMCFAVISDNVPLIELLLQYKANLELKDSKGLNLLHLMAKHSSTHALPIVCNYLDKIQLKTLLVSPDWYTGEELLQVVRGRDRRRRAWHWLQIHRHLLRAFNTKMSSGQIDVAKFGQIHVCGFGVAPDKASRDKIDLMLAERLKDKNCDMTPLHYAVHSNCKEIVQYFLENGADPNDPDFFKLTPMHGAAAVGNMSILRLLEKHGATSDVRTPQGLSPLDVAQQNNHSAAENFLQTRHTVAIAETFLTQLLETKKSLQEMALSERRSRGENIKRHLIDTLRDLTIDINTALLQLGSCPVMESTEESTTNSS